MLATGSPTQSPSPETTIIRSGCCIPVSTKCGLSKWERSSGKTRPRYTPTTCFETFPFPEPTDAQRETVAEAAGELDRLREGWLNPPDAKEAELKKRTLTNLYNARPTWLQMAHEKLDEAVMDAYGWPHDLAAPEILERLLALNLQRAGAG